MLKALLTLVAYLAVFGIATVVVYGIGIYFIVKVVKFAWGG